MKKITKKIRANLRRIILITIGSLVILVISYSVIKPRVTPLKVETATITRGDISETIISSGEIEASQSADLSFGAYGTITWVAVSEGDQVKKWQALASVDKVTLQESYNTYFIAYQTAVTNLDKYIQAEEQVKATYKDTQATELIDTLKAQAKQNTDAARLAVQTAEANLRSAEKSLKEASIVTPISGTVLAVNINVGEEALATTGIAIEVADLSGFEFAVEIDESDIGKIRLNQSATVTLNAFEGQEFRASVSKIAPSATQDSSGNKVFAVELTMVDKEGLLVGLEGDAEIILDTITSTLVIPWEAVITEGDQEYVYLIVDGLAKKVEIKTGAQSEDMYQVVEGLSADDVVILNPDEKMKDGQRVQMIND